MANKFNGGSRLVEYIRDLGSFALGAYLLLRSQDPSTVTGLVALVLMGILPASILERIFGKNGRRNGKE